MFDRIVTTSHSRHLKAITVSQIASSPLITCEQEAIGCIQDNPAYADIDQIPVRDGQRITGVFEREGSRGLVQGFHPLDGSMLVSGDQPLLDFLGQLMSKPYRLVLEGTQITGIVSVSDLNKIGMRTLAFGLISAYEQALIAFIEGECKGAPWERYLSASRLAKLSERVELHRQADTRIDPIYFSEFVDKHTVIRKMLGLGDGWKSWTETAKNLRDSVSHVRPAATTLPELQDAIRAILKIDQLIQVFCDNPSRERILKAIG